MKKNFKNKKKTHGKISLGANSARLVLLAVAGLSELSLFVCLLVGCLLACVSGDLG